MAYEGLSNIVSKVPIIILYIYIPYMHLLFYTIYSQEAAALVYYSYLTLSSSLLAVGLLEPTYFTRQSLGLLSLLLALSIQSLLLCVAQSISCALLNSCIYQPLLSNTSTILLILPISLAQFASSVLSSSYNNGIGFNHSASYGKGDLRTKDKG